MQNLKNLSRSLVFIISIFFVISVAVHFMRAEASGLSAAKKTSGLKSPEKFSSKPKLSKGKFLVASRDMKDTRFSRSAILLISYDSKGAMGLIINRPSKDLWALHSESDPQRRQCIRKTVGGGSPNMKIVPKNRHNFRHNRHFEGILEELNC